MFHIIGFIVTGLIVGLIARAIMPGRQSMGLLTTMLLGIAGSFLAGWLGRGFNWYGPEDGAGFIASTVGAIIVLGLYQLATRKRRLTSSASRHDFPRKVA